MCTVCVSGWTEVDKLNRWGRRRGRGGGIISLYLPALWPARRVSHSPTSQAFDHSYSPPPFSWHSRSHLHTLRSERGVQRLKSESIQIFFSGGQCQCRNSSDFDPNILRHSGIWGTTDEAVLNILHKKKKFQKSPLKLNFSGTKSVRVLPAKTFKTGHFENCI